MVGQIAFGVDEDGWDTFERGFFQQDNPHTRLARASHTSDDHVGGEVLGVVIGEFIRENCLRFQVVGISKIKF